MKKKLLVYYVCIVYSWHLLYKMVDASEKPHTNKQKLIKWKTLKRNPIQKKKNLESLRCSTIPRCFDDNYIVILHILYE